MSQEESKPIFYIYRADDPHSAWDYILKVDRLSKLPSDEIKELVGMLRRVADNIEEQYLSTSKNHANYVALTEDLLPSCTGDNHIWAVVSRNILDDGGIPQDDQLCVCGQVTWKDSLYNKT